MPYMDPMNNEFNCLSNPGYISLINSNMILSSNQPNDKNPIDIGYMTWPIRSICIILSSIPNPPHHLLPSCSPRSSLRMRAASSSNPWMSDFYSNLGPATENTTKSDMTLTWWFPKIGVPQNGWFIMENSIKMDDLGVPLFSETSTC